MSVEKIMVNGRELTAFDLAPEPSETYTVNVDGLGEIVVEKGKPPKEKDVPAMYMRKLVPELCKQNDALRELVKAAWRCIHSGVTCSDCRLVAGGCTLKTAMRELGVEVGA